MSKYVPCPYCGFHPDNPVNMRMCGTCMGAGVLPEKAAAYQLLADKDGFLSAKNGNELHSIDWLNEQEPGRSVDG